MDRLRGHLPLILTAVVLTCTGALLWNRGATGTALSSFHAREAARPNEQILFVAFQMADCEANLGFLSVLQRSAFKGRVRPVALFDGSTSDFNHLRPRLEGQYPHVHFAKLRRSEARTLSLLGHTSTPFWILLDESGAIRASGGAPRQPTGFARFETALLNGIGVP